MRRLPIDDTKKNHLLNFRVDEFLFNQLRDKAEISGKDMSSVIREGISDYLGIENE